MKQLQKLYLNSVIKIMSVPAALGWQISCAGDRLLEISGCLAMAALNDLGRLESEGRDAA